MLVNTWSKPAAFFAPRSGTMSMGWVGACEVAGEATAAVLTDMASWGPANAMAAHATRTIPDRRIRINRPPPSRYPGADYLSSRRARAARRRGHYHSGLPLRNRAAQRRVRRSG